MTTIHGDTSLIDPRLVAAAAANATQPAEFTNYVLCFVFDKAAENVLLLKKDHGPEILIGKWNGLGGKINDAETFDHAATREFGEESGLYVKPDAWRYFLQLDGPGYRVHCLTARFEDIANAVQTESEEVTTHPVSDVLDRDGQMRAAYCANVPWMLLLALDETTTKAQATSIN